MTYIPINYESPLISEPDAQCQEAAHRYASDRQRAGLLAFPILFLLIGILGTPAVTRALRDRAASVSSDPGIIAGLYVLVVATLVLICSLPGAYALGYVLPRKYGLTSVKPGAWWLRYIGSAIWALTYCLVIGETFYWIVRTVADWWWLVTAAVWSVAILLLNYAWPLARFGSRKLEVLNDPEIQRRLAKLTEQALLPRVGMWLLPAEPRRRVANAWLIGLGPRSRIVLSETMLQNLNYDELETLLAHELAHLKHADLLKALTLKIAGIFAASIPGYLLVRFVVGPAFGGPADVALLPYLLVYCSGVWWLILLLDGVRSRKAEKAADRYAVSLTAKPAAFRSAVIKLADLNLIEMRPTSRSKNLSPRYPTVAERTAETQPGVTKPASGTRKNNGSHRQITLHIGRKRHTVRRIRVSEDFAED